MQGWESDSPKGNHSPETTPCDVLGKSIHLCLILPPSAEQQNHEDLANASTASDPTKS